MKEISALLWSGGRGLQLGDVYGASGLVHSSQQIISGSLRFRRSLWWSRNYKTLCKCPLGFGSGGRLGRAGPPAVIVVVFLGSLMKWNSPLRCPGTSLRLHPSVACEASVLFSEEQLSVVMLPSPCSTVGLVFLVFLRTFLSTNIMSMSSFLFRLTRVHCSKRVSCKCFQAHASVLVFQQRSSAWGVGEDHGVTDVPAAFSLSCSSCLLTAGFSLPWSECEISRGSPVQGWGVVVPWTFHLHLLEPVVLTGRFEVFAMVW